MYGQNKADSIISNLIVNDGYKEITVLTAADASHTLSTADAGVINISAALATASVIQLPEATVANVGLKYNIVFTGTMAAEAKIQLPNAKGSLFAGVLHVRRLGNAAGVTNGQTTSGTTGKVQATTVVCTIAQAEKSLNLDENDETLGGGIGTDLTFYYAAKDVVWVTGLVAVNVADTPIDALQASTFTGTGY